VVGADPYVRPRRRYRQRTNAREDTLVAHRSPVGADVCEPVTTAPRPDAGCTVVDPYEIWWQVRVEQHRHGEQVPRGAVVQTTVPRKGCIAVAAPHLRGTSRAPMRSRTACGFRTK